MREYHLSAAKRFNTLLPDEMVLARKSLGLESGCRHPSDLVAGFVYRVNLATLGRFPVFTDFLANTKFVGQDVVVGQIGWEQRLHQNTEQFLQDWTFTEAFIINCGGPRPHSEFVDILLTNSKIPATPEYRNGLIAELEVGPEDPARRVT